MFLLEGKLEVGEKLGPGENLRRKISRFSEMAGSNIRHECSNMNRGGPEEDHICNRSQRELRPPSHPFIHDNSKRGSHYWVPGVYNGPSLLRKKISIHEFTSQLNTPSFRHAGTIACNNNTQPYFYRIVSTQHWHAGERPNGLHRYVVGRICGWYI